MTYSGAMLLAVASGCVLMLLIAALGAMLMGGGEFTLYFDRYHEGWFEVGGLLIILAACWWQIARFFRR